MLIRVHFTGNEMLLHWQSKKLHQKAYCEYVRCHVSLAALCRHLTETRLLSIDFLQSPDFEHRKTVFSSNMLPREYERQ